MLCSAAARTDRTNHWPASLLVSSKKQSILIPQPAPSMARRAAACAVAVAVALLAAVASSSADAWLHEEFETEGNVRAGYDARGRQVASIVLDRQSGGAFRSRRSYLYGQFSVQMKLVPGNSAGTVASFYLSSGNEPGHDEIDMEFMGNSTGQPVALNTNVWANGDGKKEQQFYLWFDPAAGYHTYTIIWNDRNVIFKVDDLFLRCFTRHADLPYPGAKPMAVHATLWDGSYWATQQGRVKVDWSAAPFVVSYRGYSADACVPAGAGRPLACPAGTDRWMTRRPSAAERGTLDWARRNYMHYDYCADGWRFPKGFPAECSRA
uniref:Xyloglucan endotransglucosylase/hydrolase n=1 Tax=Hordeum vulgare subsp. vulgare TaxID=112509 RepID=F2DXV8_HORVV|nr:predicted protein [Hordeum vulgare subsp. vulgare]BAK02273.1 predicted protein [Hordeum vulgare subsp. vulgare]